MKKYLMTGVAALALCAGFTSCSHNNDIEPMSEQEIQEAKFTANFIKKYGEPAPDQDWGFGTSTRAITRGIDNNNNMWAHYIEVPNVLTEDQKKVVREWFQKNRNPQGISVNWTNFWVQQVYKGHTSPTTSCPEIYTNAANQQVVGSDHMDKLTCGTSNEHIEKFNNGDFNGGSPTQNVSYADPYNDQNRLLTHPDMINLMVCSSTECFGYNNSESSEQRNDKFVIIPGDKIHSSVAGMYFVGLDFAANGTNANMQVAADGYYSDWIVRITPGLYRNSSRVACEDLGTSDDFDFNDVVFDVSPSQWDNGKEYTVITVQAAGGTLDLYLKAAGVEKEVHELLGVSRGTMVNTHNGTVSRPVAQFTVPGNVTPAKVAVVVTSRDAKQITLKAEKGEVPQKICVNTTFEWCNERQQIGEKYENFPAWVQNKQVSWY